MLGLNFGIGSYNRSNVGLTNTGEILLDPAFKMGIPELLTSWIFNGCRV